MNLKELTNEEIIENFFPKEPPFSGKPRENQTEIICDSIRSVLDGKKFVVISAPTGCGKSAILYTIANALCSDNVNFSNNNGAAIFTTPQKLLQDQYERDFDDIIPMKGRNNYPCYAPIDDDSKSCDNGVCLTASEHEMPNCKTEFRCPYDNAKKRAIMSRFVITNFSYFIGESNNVNSFGKRRVLIIDEAHGIESSLMSYVECTISNPTLQMCGINLSVPKFDYFEDYIPFLKNVSSIASIKLEELSGEEDERSLSGIKIDNSRKKKLKDRLTSLISKISFILINANECRWIVDLQEGKLVLKPININKFIGRLVFDFADIIILASATISKSFAGTCLGMSDFSYFDVPSTFPVESRPIFCINSGKMGYNELEKTLPKIVRDVDNIIDQFPQSKGIIHAANYRIAEYIFQHSAHLDRIITHKTKDRIDALHRHMDSNNPTVLLSPSMTEGVDLKGELSRFQIIVKIPYASLADKQVKARTEIDPIWYKNQAAITMMQSYGRSIRSKEDFAYTYVLDSGFKYFVTSNKDLFCGWFLEAIK